MSNGVIASDAAVKAIQDSVETKEIEVDDELYVTRPVFLPPKDPQPEPLCLNTLTGLVEYLKSAHDAIRQIENAWAVHVESHEKVRVIGASYGRFKQRDVYAVATAEDLFGNNSFDFDQFCQSENFIIAMQSLFIDDGQRAAVLRVVGNIKEEQVRETGDDGVTQTVIGRAGISRAAELEVPNPVILRPYRTFREVDQPASAFVLRLKQGTNGQMPSCALFEADGGRWKLDAIQNINLWLREHLPEAIIIA